MNIAGSNPAGYIVRTIGRVTSTLPPEVALTKLLRGNPEYILGQNFGERRWLVKWSNTMRLGRISPEGASHRFESDTAYFASVAELVEGGWFKPNY